MTDKEKVELFYTKALTVNNETRPTAALTPIFTDDFVSKGSVASKTKEELIGQLEYFWKLIPNLKWEIQEVINEGNKYAVRSIASGNPNGDFMGTPTDGSKSFKIMTLDVHTVIDGKIASVYHLEDWGTAMKQLQS